MQYTRSGDHRALTNLGRIARTKQRGVVVTIRNTSNNFLDTTNQNERIKAKVLTLEMLLQKEKE